MNKTSLIKKPHQRKHNLVRAHVPDRITLPAHACLFIEPCARTRACRAGGMRRHAPGRRTSLSAPLEGLIQNIGAGQHEEAVPDHRDRSSVGADRLQQPHFLIGNRDIRVAAEIGFVRIRVTHQ